jgi:hypothetical protein
MQERERQKESQAELRDERSLRDVRDYTDP